MPPATTERLEQGRGIGETIGLCLHLIDPGLLIGLFGAQQRQRAGVAVLPLPLRQIQRHLRGIGGAGGRLQALGVLLERRKGVGDILESGQHRVAILFARLHVGGLCRALLVQQCPALEDGCSQGRAQTPESGRCLEHLTNCQCGAAGICGQGDIRQPVRNCDSDLGAGGVHVGLGLEYIRTLRHQFRRQAHRQFLRQSQTRQIEWIRRRLVRKPSGQDGQKVALLGELLAQRRQRGGDLRELRFLRGDIQPAGIAFGILVAQDLQHVGVDVDELAGRVDLRLQCCLLDRRDHHIGGQRGVRRDHLESNRLRLRLHRFHGAAVQAEHIGHIRDADLRGEQLV